MLEINRWTSLHEQYEKKLTGNEQSNGVYQKNQSTPTTSEDIRCPEVRGYIPQFSGHQNQCTEKFDDANDDNEAFWPNLNKFFLVDLYHVEMLFSVVRRFWHETFSSVPFLSSRKNSYAFVVSRSDTDAI